MGWAGGDCGMQTRDSGVAVRALVAMRLCGWFQCRCQDQGGRRKAGSLLSGSTRRLEGIRNFSSINRKWWLQSYLNRGDFKQIQLSWDIWIWFEWNWIETKDENCPDENCNVKWHFDHKNDSWCESGHWDWPQIKNMKRLSGSLDNTCLWIGKWVLITGSI